MKKLLIPACYLFCTVLALTSCSNTKSKSSNDIEHNEHDGHDHSNHDHAGHDHASHAHSNNSQPTQASQPAPASTIPLFTFYKVKSGVSFTNADIPKGKKTVFILFDPGCSHCQQETSELAKNYSKIKNINLYFISMNDPALQAKFLETFGKELVGKPNVEVLYDKNQDFIQKFHIPNQFPANYVYSADGKLQSYWDGSKNINEIIKEYTK